ncbi:hypothetical protein [Saezia sanguinis]|uniref:hypothetical protein n=1 Tax=Saezia sanguinis TaxID=1965230 RepID=UPI003059EE1F
MKKERGDFIFGAVCGILCTLLAVAIIPVVWDFSTPKQMPVGNALAHIYVSKKLTPGFNDTSDLPEVEMLYLFDNDDFILSTTDGALVWQHKDPQADKHCYGAPAKYMPMDCRME